MGIWKRREGKSITQKEVNDVFKKQVERCASVMKKKTREYTGDEEDMLCAF